MDEFQPAHPNESRYLFYEKVMKALGFKLIFLLVLGVFVLPMQLPGPDGKPIMTMEGWIPRDLIASIKGAFDKVDTDALDGTIVGEGAEIYHWRDEKGVLHYSDKAVSGANSMVLPHDGLAIPSERFVRSGLAPAEDETAAIGSSSRGSAILLEEHSFPGSSKSRKRTAKSGKQPSLKDVEALANGDFSNSAEMMQNLPALLEQLKEARSATHAAAK